MLTDVETASLKEEFICCLSFPGREDVQSHVGKHQDGSRREESRRKQNHRASAAVSMRKTE